MKRIEPLYEFVLWYLRWALASKTELVRVVEIGPVNAVPPLSEPIPSRVVIEVLNLPVGHAGGPKLPVTGKAVSRFLESREFRNQFIKWYGEQIAVNLEKKSAPARLVKRFRRSSVGRAGPLPPPTCLKIEYDRLLLEIKALQDSSKSRPTSQGEDALLRFGQQTNTHWVKFIEAGTVGFDQLLRGSPQSAAKLILAMKYGYGENTDPVHRRLFQRGK